MTFRRRDIDNYSGTNLKKWWPQLLDNVIPLDASLTMKPNFGGHLATSSQSKGGAKSGGGGEGEGGEGSNHATSGGAGDKQRACQTD